MNKKGRAENMGNGGFTTAVAGMKVLTTFSDEALELLTKGEPFYLTLGPDNVWVNGAGICTLKNGARIPHYQHSGSCLKGVSAQNAAHYIGKAVWHSRPFDHTVFPFALPIKAAVLPDPTIEWF